MTQLSDADLEFAIQLVKEMRTALESVGLAWAYPGPTEKIINKARALRDAEREPEIAALRAENARLREALEKIAKYRGKPEPLHGDYEKLTRMWMSQCRTLQEMARAAFGGENG